MKVIKKKLLDVGRKKFRAWNNRREVKKRAECFTSSLPARAFSSAAPGEAEHLSFWDGFSIKPSVLYYRGYSNLTGRHDPRFVPSDMLNMELISCLNDEESAETFSDSYFLNRYFPGNILPKSLFRNIEGVYYNTEHEIIFPDQDAVSSLTGSVQAVIVRPSSQSHHLQKGFIFRLSGDGKLREKHGRPFRLQDVEEKFDKNFTVEEWLKPHPFFSKTIKNPGAVRFIVYRSHWDEQAHILSAHLVPALTEPDDIELLKNGMLFVADEHGNVTDIKNHLEDNGEPQTNRKSIPMFEKMKKLAVQVSSDSFYHRLLAIDVIARADESVTLWRIRNQKISPIAVQLTGRPLFGELTGEVLDACKSTR